MEEESERVRLMKRLRVLYAGEAKEVRAALVGVDRTTMGRWDKRVNAGEEPPISDSQLEALRRAVNTAEAGASEYGRGLSDAINAVRKTLADLERTIPRTPESISADEVEGHGPDTLPGEGTEDIAE